MASPARPVPIKLIIGLISQVRPELDLAVKILENKFGKTDRESALLDFSCTRYYEDEFGDNLKRKFLSFERLVGPEGAHRIKLYTNKAEKRLSQNGNRTVNIDPGYVSLAKLVLFTTKDRSHRIYLAGGIYADIELSFENKSFRPLQWTYADYKSEPYVMFFNSVREKYASQLKRYKPRSIHALIKGGDLGIERGKKAGR